jgi:hypothetical protein
MARRGAITLSIVRISQNIESGCHCKRKVLQRQGRNETAGSRSLRTDRTMKNTVSGTEERQFITKEFADTLAGKNPAPYLRVHDPVQQALVALGQYDCRAQGRQTDLRPYLDRMIHFWREVSLAGLPCAGKTMDECYALLFESAFSLAQSERVWALDCLTTQPPEDVYVNALRHLAHQVKAATIAHFDLVSAFTHLYAPRREQSVEWQNPVNVALAGELWFWAAIYLAVGDHEADGYLSFHRAIAKSAATDWTDAERLHIRLIREAPRRPQVMPRIQLMAHPILRIARLKYREGSVEQTQVLRFLNAQCIKQGFESEEDYFLTDLPLAQWTRDARQWATNLLTAEPEVCEQLFHEAGEKTVERTRIFYRQHLGSRPSHVDSLDVTAALIKWAKQRRGFEFSQYRAQLWEFVVEIADAALWLGWLFPVANRNEVAQEEAQ